MASHNQSVLRPDVPPSGDLSRAPNSPPARARPERGARRLRRVSATLSPLGDVAAVLDATRDETSLRRFLHGLPGVDQVGAEARAAALATRSIKAASKAWAVDAAVRMVDLTTLEGADTPGKVRSLCAKAMRPDPSDD